MVGGEPPWVGGRRRIPCIWTTLVLAAILSRGIWASLPPWVHLVLSITAGQQCGDVQCSVHTHQAQFGKYPWVRGLCAP